MMASRRSSLGRFQSFHCSWKSMFLKHPENYFSQLQLHALRWPFQLGSDDWSIIVTRVARCIRRRRGRTLVLLYERIKNIALRGRFYESFERTRERAPGWGTCSRWHLPLLLICRKALCVKAFCSVDRDNQIMERTVHATNVCHLLKIYASMHYVHDS